MPASGVSVDAVDPVFQAKMMDMLRQIGRYLGWWDVDGVPLKLEKSVCRYKDCRALIGQHNEPRQQVYPAIGHKPCTCIPILSSSDGRWR